MLMPLALLIAVVAGMTGMLVLTEQLDRHLYDFNELDDDLEPALDPLATQ
jgi:hypothetical protein